MAQGSASDTARMRTVAVVIAVTAVLWVGFQWLGPRLGLAGEYAFLIDLSAMAAFLWALVLAVALWRDRSGGNG